MSTAIPMSRSARLINYARQNRSWNLTPAQRRRWDKKDRAGLKRAGLYG